MPSRPYTHPDDLPRLVEFLHSARPPERASDYPGVVDLEELLADPQIRQQTRLWLDAQGALRAYAILADDQLLFDLLPAGAAELGPEMIRWAAELRRATGASLFSSCAAADAARQSLLRAWGFTREPDFSLHYARSLLDPLPEPVLLPGFSIRALHGEAEAEAAAALHRAAFGTDYMTTENRLAMMRTSGYAPDMDLVAVAPDGCLAAYTMGSLSAENALTGRKDGFTDPVATHPDYQRLGLARALLLTAMQMLKARGLETVKLGTDGENLSMQKTAEAVGFVVVEKTLRFKQALTG
jgi:mycothiol synthase